MVGSNTTEDWDGPSRRLLEWICRSNYATATGEISGYRKAMCRSTSHNDGGEGSDAAFLHRSSSPPCCSSSFLTCQRGFQSSVNLGKEVFGPAASASAAGTCSATFGSFVPMFSLPICLHRP